MQLHNVQPHTARKKSVQVGRGGKRGKTSGRGTKGQNARSGRKKRPEMRDIIKTLPKLRGRGKHGLRTIQDAFFTINVGMLNRIFENGETVSPETLRAKGALSKYLGLLPKVKILADGEISKKLVIEKCALSATAKTAIEKAGGKIQ